MSPERPESYDEANERMRGAIRGESMGDEPSLNEQEAVRRAALEMRSDTESPVLFESEFKARFGITFQADPPDSIMFEYGGDGVVIVRVMARAEAGGSVAASVQPRLITQSLSVAGLTPTAAEIETALESAYASGAAPVAGDLVNLTVSGTIKFRSIISNQGATNGRWVVPFTVGPATYYGNQHQTGLY